jgi:hypothetical protein
LIEKQAAISALPEKFVDLWLISAQKPIFTASIGLPFYLIQMSVQENPDHEPRSLSG